MNSNLNPKTHCIPSATTAPRKSQNLRDGRHDRLQRVPKTLNDNSQSHHRTSAEVADDYGRSPPIGIIALLMRRRMTWLWMWRWKGNEYAIVTYNVFFICNILYVFFLYVVFVGFGGFAVLIVATLFCVVLFSFKELSGNMPRSTTTTWACPTSQRPP